MLIITVPSVYVGLIMTPTPFHPPPLPHPGDRTKQSATDQPKP